METPLTPWQAFAHEGLKKQFAAHIRVRPNTPEARFEAACLVFPKTTETPLVIKCAEEWPYDAVVVRELERLAKDEPEAGLPTAEQQARDVYNLASDPTKGIDDRIKAHKLFAEIRGYIRKPAEAGVNVHIDNRRVMFLREPPKTADDWERGALIQQANLFADAAR